MLTLLRRIMVWNAVIEGLKGLAQAVQIGPTPSVIWTYPQINTPINDIIPTRFMENGFAELFFYPDSAKRTINIDCISVDISGNLTVGSKQIMSGIDSFLFNAATISRSPTNFSLITTNKFDYPNSGGMGLKVSHLIIDNYCAILSQNNLTSAVFSLSVFGGSPIIFQNAAQHIVSVRDSSASFVSCNTTISNSPAISIDTATDKMSQQNTTIPQRYTSITPTLDGFAFTTPVSLTGCATGDSLIFSSSSGAVQSSKPLNRTSNCALTNTQAGQTITLCIPSILIQQSTYAVILSVYNPDHSLNATYAIKSSTKFVEYASPSVAVSELNAAIYAMWIEPTSNSFPQLHAQPFTLTAKPIPAFPEVTIGSQATPTFGHITALDGANVLITYFNDPKMFALKLNWPNPAAATTTTTSLSTLSSTPQQSLNSTASQAMWTLGTGFLPFTSTLSTVITASTADAKTTGGQTSSQPTTTLETTTDLAPSSVQPTLDDNHLGTIIGIAMGAGLAVSSLIMFIAFFLRHQHKSADNPKLADEPQELKPPGYASPKRPPNSYSPAGLRYKDGSPVVATAEAANPYINFEEVNQAPAQRPHYQDRLPSEQTYADAYAQFVNAEGLAQMNHEMEQHQAQQAQHASYDDIDILASGRGMQPN